MKPIALAALLALASASPARRASTPISAISAGQWKALNSSVGGRLFAEYPIAKPCYSRYEGKTQLPDLGQCSAVQNGYTSDSYIASQPGGYMNTNWGWCQSTADECGLDFNAPQDPSYYALPNECHQGSVPSYYIAVEQVSDVQAALKFARKHKIPLITKNSGHDYKGRSSAPNSLQLWTHTYQPAITRDRDFTPEGCSKSVGDTINIGAGQGFNGIYEFAEAGGITIVGGSSRTVGAAGGWLAGAGHGALSNTLGLGVDNVQQIKAVLPNGTYITANRCQNTDAFYALRGGGGNTFGIAMEVTYRANPQVTLQVAYIRFLSSDTDSINKFIDLCVQNADKWARQGWGGYIAPGAQSQVASGMIFFTPKLNHAQAVRSMKPITDYVASLGNIVLNNEVDTSPSWYQAYVKYILPNDEAVGLGIAIGSRLIPRDLVKTSAGRKKVSTAIKQASQIVVPLSSTQSDPDVRSLVYGAPLQILVTAPSNYDASDDAVPSSITPAWRSAVWHVVVGQGFANDANTATINKAFQRAYDAAQILRAAAPDSGAYQNEADVFEPDPIGSYWGQSNYNRLLSIKKEFDPDNVLTCWDCIGWDSSDARYGCYPAKPT